MASQTISEQQFIIQRPHQDAIREEYSPVVARAETLMVTDVIGHEAAGELLLDLRRAKKTVQRKLDPIVKDAHSVHKKLTTLRSELLEPIAVADEIVCGKMDVYEREQQRIADEKAAEAQAEAEALEEDRQLAEAAEAQDAGDIEAAEDIVSRPIEAPIVESRPDVAKVAGVSSRSSYKVQVVDVVMLAQHVVDNPQWANLIMGNMTVLNGLARSQQQAFTVPGCRLVKDTVRTVRAT